MHISILICLRVYVAELSAMECVWTVRRDQRSDQTRHFSLNSCLLNLRRQLSERQTVRTFINIHAAEYYSGNNQITIICGDYFRTTSVPLDVDGDVVLRPRIVDQHNRLTIQQRPQSLVLRNSR